MCGAPSGCWQSCSEWDPATGDQTVTCAEDPKVCPTADDLARIRRIELWAEGAKGDARIEVKSISAGVKNPQYTKLPFINTFSSIQENYLGVSFALDLYGKRKQNAELTSSEIALITFDGEPSTTFKFKQYNDPVMVRSIRSSMV